MSVEPAQAAEMPRGGWDPVEALTRPSITVEKKPLHSPGPTAAAEGTAPAVPVIAEDDGFDDGELEELELFKALRPRSKE